ncbi:hypothetical protein ACV33P_30355, partial [Pseudomonas aeruginosa]
QGIELALRDAGSGELSVETYDAVILATGYERQLHRQLLEPLAEYLGDHEIGRDYRLQTDERCKVAIYAQGFRCWYREPEISSARTGSTDSRVSLR